MRAIVLLLISSFALFASAENKIIKLGNLTIECFAANCEQKLKEINDYVIENDSPELGWINTIVFADWWSKPTVKGRTIINAADTPAVILSYLSRNGMKAREAIFDARDIGEELRTKSELDVTCEFRTVAERCAEVVKQLRDITQMAAKENLKFAPQSIEIMAIDWHVDNSAPKAILFGAIASDKRRYKTEPVLTTQDLYKQLKANSALVPLENTARL